MGGGAPADRAAPAGGEAAVEKAPEVEEPKEKTHYDVELQAFDPASKIKLIKEIR
jgi:ribosomal protein L7/L12